MKFGCTLTLEISAPFADAYCISKKFAQANHTPASNQNLKQNIDNGKREPVTVCSLDGTRRTIMVRKGPLSSNNRY